MVYSTVYTLQTMYLKYPLREGRAGVGWFPFCGNLGMITTSSVVAGRVYQRVQYNYMFSTIHPPMCIFAHIHHISSWTLVFEICSSCWKKKHMSSLPLLAKVLWSLDCMQYAIGPRTNPARPCTVQNVFPFLQFSLPNITGTQRIQFYFSRQATTFFLHLVFKMWQWELPYQWRS